jgi:hypothetical protein
MYKVPARITTVNRRYHSQSVSKPETGGNVADDPNAHKIHGFQPDGAQAAKKLSALIVVLIPMLAALLPMPYKAFVPFLFLIPLFISLANKFGKADEKSGNPLPNRTYSMPKPGQDHPIEPYLYTPRDPKDPRRYRPIG